MAVGNETLNEKLEAAAAENVGKIVDVVVHLVDVLSPPQKMMFGGVTDSWFRYIFVHSIQEKLDGSLDVLGLIGKTRGYTGYEESENGGTFILHGESQEYPHKNITPALEGDVYDRVLELWRSRELPQ